MGQHPQLSHWVQQGLGCTVLDKQNPHFRQEKRFLGRTGQPIRMLGDRGGSRKLFEKKRYVEHLGIMRALVEW